MQEVQESKPDQAVSVSHAASIDPPSGSSREPWKVLLIDDQRMVGEAVRRLLRPEPAIEFHFCQHAAQALAEAGRLQPTLILQDLVMPDADGLDLVKQFRAQAATANVPIIVLSSREDARIKADSFQAGANDYLVKLPDQTELLARLRYHCGAYTLRLELDTAMRELRRNSAELEQQKMAAEAANQAKSAFLANMSHELRTPLNAIIGYSEMLAEQAEDENNTDYLPDLAKIQTAGHHLLSLINSLLDLSKIEAGKATLFLEDFSARKIVDEVLSMAKPLATKNRNTMLLRSFAGPEAMHADAVKLRQILFNLLGNACKFTSDGTVGLTVGPSRTAAGAEGMRFSVDDSGIGMTETQMKRLFQPFTQAETTTARQFGGTGLGLVLSRNFAEMMGGEITLESVPGSGSTFHVTLPVCVQEQQTL